MGNQFKVSDIYFVGFCWHASTRLRSTRQRNRIGNSISKTNLHITGKVSADYGNQKGFPFYCHIWFYRGLGTICIQKGAYYLNVTAFSQ